MTAQPSPSMLAALRVIAEHDPLVIDTATAKRLRTGSVVALIRHGFIVVREHREWKITLAGREALAEAKAATR